MNLAKYELRSMACCFVICTLALWCLGCGSDDVGEVEVPVCSITQLNVSGDMIWLTGEPVNIRWTGNGVPKTVLIEALKDGVVVGTIAESSNNDGFHSWSASTFEQPGGAGYGIRVSGTNEANCESEISGMTITDVAGCNITLVALPDTLNAGSLFDITWNRQFTSGAVDIELRHGLGTGDQSGVIALGVADTGVYTWDVDSFHEGTRSDYKIIISDAQVPACASTSPSLTIVDEEVCEISVGGPAQGQVFDEGDVLAFQLVQANGSRSVDLRLYIGNIFVPGGYIANNVSTLRDTSWVVNDFDHDGDTTNYRVKAIDSLDGYCTGVSDFFTINRQ